MDEQVNDTVTNNICQISASPRNRSIFRLLLVSHFVDRWGESSSNSYCRVMVHITHAIARAGVYKSIQEFVAIADSDSGKQRWTRWRTLPLFIYRKRLARSEPSKLELRAFFQIKTRIVANDTPVDRRRRGGQSG